MPDLRQQIAGFSPKKQELLLRLLKGKGQELPRLRPMPRSGNAPLSYAQEGAWYVEQLQPGTAFNIPLAFRLLGHLDIDALESSLNLVVRRHEVLRTTFAEIDGQPFQVIAPSLQLTVATTDIAGGNDNERMSQLIKQVIEWILQPFDLSHGPLLRMKVFRLNTDDHFVVCAVYHGVFDGWSLDVFSRELGTFYTSLVSGTEISIPDLPVQYADYALWQREILQGEFFESQLGYWMKQLAQHPAALSLPTDHPESTAKLFRGDAVTFQLSPAVSEGLRTLARNERSTLFMVLLAAFKLLLARYSGQDDIVVGTPIANRSQPEQEKLIGFCVNLLALRTNVSGNPSFQQLLQRVREICLAAYKHQDLPFGVLVQHLHPDRYATHSPIFQVQFALEDTRKGNAGLAGLQSGSFSADDPLWEELGKLVAGGAPAVDHLFLQMLDSGQELFGTVLFRTDLFDRATIARMMKHFVRLLEAVVAQPDATSIALLTEEEQRQIIHEWNETREEIGPTRCVHERFEATADQRPDRIAVSLSRGMRRDRKEYELTYGELDQRANQLARYLKDRGVKEETRVGLCVGRSLELAVGVLGILKSGGAYVPLDLGQPIERLKKVIESSGVSVVVVTRQAEKQQLLDLAVGLLVVEVDESRGERKERLHAGVGGQNAAYVIYTSGSTGEPKGVVVSHASVVNHNMSVIRRFRLAESDRVLQFHTVSFDAAVEELFPTWGVGATVVMRSEELVAPGDELEKLIQQEQLTVVNLPTAYWHEWVVDAERRQAISTDGLKLVVAGGDKVSAERYRKWRELTGGHVRWVNTYGPTETTVISSFWEPNERDSGEVSGGMSIGRPIGNTRMYVLGALMEPVPVGVSGELWIAGDGLARGYLERSDLTAERFMPDPFAGRGGERMYRTGDRARYRPDGRLEFLGRVDEQVKIRGFRVELGEIQSALKRHSGVQDAVVVLDDSGDEKHLMAFVIAAEGAQPTEPEVRDFLNSQLPAYMVPSGITFMDRFPFTAGGKIDRRALSTQRNVASEIEVPYLEPHTSTEKELARIWNEVLGLERIGIHDNFFSLGGHSLLAARLMSRLNAEFGIELPLRVVIERPTIAGLAVLVEKGGLIEAGQHPDLIALRPGTLKQPFFLVHAADGSVIGYMNLARHLELESAVYGLEHPLVHGEAVSATTFEALASRYVEAIISIQPEGPYRLGGWSLGGIIAYEVAQQLCARGHNVDLLALLDASALHPTATYQAITSALNQDSLGLGLTLDEFVRLDADQRSEFLIEKLKQASQVTDDVEALRWVARNLGMPFDQLTFLLKELLPQEERWIQLLDRASKAHGPISEFRQQQLRARLRVLESNGTAFRDYVFQPYPGRIALFRPESAQNGDDLYLGWDKLAIDGVELCSVPGQHYTMLSEPAVRDLAKALRIRINNVSVDQLTHIGHHHDT